MLVVAELTVLVEAAMIRHGGVSGVRVEGEEVAVVEMEVRHGGRGWSRRPQGKRLGRSDSHHYFILKEEAQAFVQALSINVATAVVPMVRVDLLSSASRVTQGFYQVQYIQHLWFLV